MLTVILLFLVAFTQVFVSLGILLESRHKRNSAQKIFVALSISTLIWTIANTVLLQVDSAGSAANIRNFDLVNRAAFFLACCSLLLIYVFSLYYPIKKQVAGFQKVIIISGTIFAVLSPFTFIAGHFAVIDGRTTYFGGAFSPVIAVFALVVILAIYKDNATVLRHTKDRMLGRQTRTLLAGLTLTIIHATLFIIILPITYSDSSFIYAIGYLSPYYFMCATVYSLLRQNLFDVRLIIARTVAYLLLLTSAALIFAVLVITLPASVIGFDRPNLARQAYYTFSAVVLALAFQPLKKTFDKITNRLFYQDAYDPQDFLNRLNKLLVSSIDLEYLLVNSSKVIQESLKTEYALFALKETETEKQRFIGTSEKHFSREDVNFARRVTPYISSKVIVADYLEQSDHELRSKMQRNKIAALVRLVENAENGQEGLGYIILGHKKSGNPFNSQDVKVLEIVANELVIAIQNALRFEEIQNFNLKLQEEVERATKQLQRTNAKLVALDETKDDFISMASHQLRTPLTSVKGYLSMVIEGDVGKVNPKQEKLLTQAFISSERMVYLIADLLNVSRLRTGKFVIEPRKTNLAEIIEGEVRQLVETAQSRGLKLTYQKPKDFPDLMLDETKIRQVIMNFTDNAIHYTPSGGHIKVELSETAQSVQFTVTDDGIGVPKHEQHHLFTKFFRAGNARKARPDGTGLGLFMAKKVVIAQGGSLIFKSNEGKGSTFGFTFAKAHLKPTIEK